MPSSMLTPLLKSSLALAMHIEDMKIKNNINTNALFLTEIINTS